MPIKIGTTGFNSPIAKAIVGQTVVYEPNTTKTVSYYGAITNLTNSGNLETWGNIGNYAAFVGGQSGDYRTALSSVELYDKDLTHSTGTPLNEARRGLVFAKLGNLGCFFGGKITGSSDAPASAYVYDNDMTRTYVTMQHTRCRGAAASSANLAITYGTETTSSRPPEALDSNLTLHVGSDPGGSYFHINGAARAGNYAVFAFAYNYKKQARIYDDNLTMITDNNGSVSRFQPACATINNKAVFAGGQPGNYSYSDAVDIFDTDLTHTSTTLIATTYGINPCVNMPTVDKYMICGNKYESANNNYTVFIDKDFTSQSLSGNGVSGVSCGGIGNYFIVCGGNDLSTPANTVYAYKVS